MKILHLSSERNWRGGENQLVLLVSNLPGNIGSIVAAPKGSAILSRLGQGFETREIACRGALDIRSVFVVRRLVKDRGIDLIHAHTSKAHEVGLLACFLTGIPLVVSRRVAFPISGGWKYRRADRLIAVSAAASAELRKVGVPPARIVVIHDAVDPKAAQESRAERAGASGSEVLVLCAAAFAGEKDHQLLLDAWRIVEDSAPRGRLHLAGDGPLRDSIVEGIRKRGLKRVHLLGWRNDVAQLLQGADIVTLSSREEGFASVLCEAQMKGKPVVATRAGGIPEAILDGRTGLLSDVSDAPSLARNLILLIHDEHERLRLGAQGRRHALATFDAASIADQHAAVYSSALEKR